MRTFTKVSWLIFGTSAAIMCIWAIGMLQYAPLDALVIMIPCIVSFIFEAVITEWLHRSKGRNESGEPDLLADMLSGSGFMIGILTFVILFGIFTRPSLGWSIIVGFFLGPFVFGMLGIMTVSLKRG